ncbi:hypothetical protein ACHAQD_010918 [Fusarium lateritium]
MDNTSQTTSASSVLGQWVQDLYSRLFIQPDDQVLINAFKDDIAEDFNARINHEQFTRPIFMDAILKFRIGNTATVQSTKDIQVWETPDGSGAGCVVQHIHVTDTNKETGIGTKSSTLLVASIKVIDGQRKLVDLTEVVKSIDLFTGAFTTKEYVTSEGDWRASPSRISGDDLDINVKLAKQFQTLADKKGYTPAQLAITWLLKQGEDIFPIPGTKRIKYLEENWASLGVQLTDSDEAEIREFANKAGAAGNRGGQGFADTVAQP